MSRYAPPAAYLRNQGGPAVKLTFGDIERLIQADLPPIPRANTLGGGAIRPRPIPTHGLINGWRQAGRLTS